MWPFRKSAGAIAEIPDGPYRADYEAIVRGLAALRGDKKARSGFGASSHRFAVNPVLPALELEQFEASHGIRLPEDYRGFLLHVGNGGAGPGYGVFRLGEIDDQNAMRRWNKNDEMMGDPSLPFPHSGAWNDRSGEPSVESGLSEAEEDAQYARLSAWEEEHYFNPRHVNGAIPLCHLGDALRQWLVVTGPEAGHVWGDSRAEKGGIFPEKAGAKERVTFLQWYKRWMDEALRASGA